PARYQLPTVRRRIVHGHGTYRETDHRSDIGTSRAGGVHIGKAPAPTESFPNPPKLQRAERLPLNARHRRDTLARRTNRHGWRRLGREWTHQETILGARRTHVEYSPSTRRKAAAPTWRPSFAAPTAVADIQRCPWP